MKALAILVAALFVIGGLGPAAAQFSGPTGTGARDIKGILASPKDDKNVILRGHLVQQQSHDKYLFSDGTGEILLEIDRWRMPGVQITPKTLVEISGEVETRVNRPPKIEVKRITILPDPPAPASK